MFKKISLLSFLLFSISSLNANFSSWFVAAKMHVAGLFKDLPKNYYLECEKQKIRDEVDEFVKKTEDSLLVDLNYSRSLYERYLLESKLDEGLSSGLDLHPCSDSCLLDRAKSVLEKMGISNSKFYWHQDKFGFCNTVICLKKAGEEKFKYNKFFCISNGVDPDDYKGPLGSGLDFVIAHEGCHWKHNDTFKSCFFKEVIDVMKENYSEYQLRNNMNSLSNLEYAFECRADVYALTYLNKLENPIKEGFSKNNIGYRGSIHPDLFDVSNTFENKLLPRMREAKAKDDAIAAENSRKHADAERVTREALNLYQ
jgi:hypothetical protein